MRIQVLSDLHLEFGFFAPPKTDADVVVVAGDIHLQTKAISWLTGFNKPVIYVAGNHEMWGGDWHKRLQELKSACSGTQVHFLENEHVTLDDVTFYGASLWTDFRQYDDSILDTICFKLNDFGFITVDGSILEPRWLASYNHATLQWLDTELSQGAGKHQVVVTHHAPSLRSWGFDADDPLRYAYCNELDEQIRRWGPALWVHGHIHCSSDYMVLDTRVVCNPRGYHPNNLVNSFEPKKVVEV